MKMNEQMKNEMAKAFQTATNYMVQDAWNYWTRIFIEAVNEGDEQERERAGEMLNIIKAEGIRRKEAA